MMLIGMAVLFFMARLIRAGLWAVAGVGAGAVAG